MTNIIFSKEPIEFDNYFICNLENISGNKYTVAKGRSNIIRRGYYEIYIRADKELWESCRFHFEIKWSNKLTLQETNKVSVYPHIESGSYIKNPEHNMRIRNAFAKKDRDNIINKDDIREVTVDFSSESTTLNSIKQILNVLDSAEFDDVAKKINELL